MRFFGGVWKGKAGARRLYIERFRKRFTHDNNGPIDGFLLDHPQIAGHRRHPARRRDRQDARALDDAGRAPPDFADDAAGLGVRQWWEGGLYENTYKKARTASGASTCSTTSRTGMPTSTRAGPIPIPNMCLSSRRSIPKIPTGPDELIEDHWLWPTHKLLPFHMKHPITGEEMVAERWEGDAKRDAERAKAQ